MKEYKRIIVRLDMDGGVDSKGKQIIISARINNANPNLEDDKAKEIAQALAGLTSHEYVGGTRLVESTL